MEQTGKALIFFVHKSMSRTSLIQVYIDKTLLKLLLLITNSVKNTVWPLNEPRTS